MLGTRERKNLDNREQDLRCRGAQGHQGQVGNGLVPDPYRGHCGFTVGFGDGHLFLLLDSFSQHRGVVSDPETQKLTYPEN